MAANSILGPRIQGGLPKRVGGTNWSANPVGVPDGITRETLPMEQNAPPRYQHPKLNTKPWSTSYAVKRKTPAKMKRGK